MTASKAFSLSLRRKPWGKKYKCHVLVNMVVKIPKHQVKKATSKNALNLKISCKFSLHDSNLILTKCLYIVRMQSVVVKNNVKI